MAMIIGYGIVMLGVCMLGCVVPTRRALNIERSALGSPAVRHT
jgi:hypothetical protein